MLLGPLSPNRVFLSLLHLDSDLPWWSRLGQILVASSSDTWRRLRTYLLRFGARSRLFLAQRGQLSVLLRGFT